MRETRLSGSEGGGFEFNRFSLPLSANLTVPLTPNPPIAEELGGMWTSQPRTDAEETPWEGMSVP